MSTVLIALIGVTLGIVLVGAGVFVRELTAELKIFQEIERGAKDEK